MQPSSPLIPFGEKKKKRSKRLYLSLSIIFDLLFNICHGIEMGLGT